MCEEDNAYVLVYVYTCSTCHAFTHTCTHLELVFCEHGQRLVARDLHTLEALAVLCGLLHTLLYAASVRFTQGLRNRTMGC
jgi:hypothetical protein